MTKRTPWHDIHSTATAQLLKFAFASAEAACAEGGGYTLGITLKSGATFEGAPVADCAEDIGAVLVLENGHFILTHEIAALTVNQC
ncbi:hypothetical protein [Methylobacterium sp. R2-1]|uniref:hypothetical protein n=1 Tax=Methylobacterium sp. R2-1 TaxID=2587064 RepID=UPI00161B6109|nr:hypothetical protein [Methylobacterium sp. R2-1]MBB2964745.1 hypothetical protein [Methylobacterium sp. R2-1]